MSDFTGAATPLSEADIVAAAAELGVEPAIVRAVDEVESRGQGFLPDKRPTILFERHIFSRRTGHRYDIGHPGISNPRPGGYGKGGANQYKRLAEAIRLDRRAALQSASWGRYQVMGFNAELCGWPNVEAFVIDMCKSEALHLQAFVGYCQANNLVRHLKSRDFRSFTAGYNGTGNVEEYSRKLEAAYEKHAAATPDAAVASLEIDAAIRDFESKARSLQIHLQASGYYRGKVDGDWGPMSRQSLADYKSGVNPR